MCPVDVNLRRLDEEGPMKGIPKLCVGLWLQ